jgi:hypothetical protein
MDDKVFTFSDDLVATVAQLLQLAILTGTDVYDHLRTVQVVEQEGALVVAPAYREKLNAEILRLSQRAEQSSQQPEFTLETD